MALAESLDLTLAAMEIGIQEAVMTREFLAFQELLDTLGTRIVPVTLPPAWLA